MTPDHRTATEFAVSDLSTGHPTRFEILPDAATRAALAADLGIVGIRKLRFSGEISPDGKRDWRLVGKLGATVVQACVVTLAPVTTRIDTEVSRRFLAAMPDLVLDDAGEAEMPDDDTIEPLGARIDTAQVMAEALALNLPLYPRAEGADLGTAVFTEPGVDPLTDEAVKAFASLAKLRDKLGKTGGDDPSD